MEAERWIKGISLKVESISVSSLVTSDSVSLRRVSSSFRNITFPVDVNPIVLELTILNFVRNNFRLCFELFLGDAHSQFFELLVCRRSVHPVPLSKRAYMRLAMRIDIKDWHTSSGEDASAGAAVALSDGHGVNAENSV